MQVTDEDGLSEALAAAQGPVHLQGGGTRGLGRALPETVLDLSALRGVTLYEPGALTLVARAGTPVAEIEAMLAGEGQRLAFEPYMLGAGVSTIGGVMAANASGPRRISVGAARDFLLGVRFVDGAGRVISNGGRVMKNVTGYDLVKLMAGSWGTLGALSEVSLKVLPGPEAVGRLVIHGQDVAGAVQAMSQALGSPFEVSAAVYLPEARETMLRVEGFEVQVRHRLEALRARLSDFGDVTTDDAGDWRDIRDAQPVAGAGDLWRISVRPSDAPGVIGALPEGARYQLDWGGGLIWARLPAGTDARAALGGLRGHATLMQADAGTHRRLGTFQPEAPAVASLTAGLRAQFDPKGILNAPLLEGVA